ncbi:DNA polymerase III subunit beta [Falsiroseomonas sp.]|uniref:DNA polymerase III subunit beta n=1 Tax=Falsiroseomonas sp. TaxID=2870721 RepID=UPI002734CD93|nr:DNA polymerase III subunit beta [Falsiroseomonas sp.]MDP3417893.1 DNA polymerase III subunit beta [Falsiroseomonas sp.]
MTLSIKTTAGILAQALITTGRVTEKRNTIPVLGMVLLRADQDGIRLDATDLDIALTLPVKGNVVAPGAVLLDGGKSLRTMLCAAPPDDMVTVTQEDARVVVTCGPLRIEEDAVPEEEWATFIEAAAEDVTATIQIAARDLVALMEAVWHCISTEETRYYLNGICFSAEGQELLLVATDGHRLMSTQLPVLRGPVPLPNMIVPTKLCRFLREMLPQVQGDWPIDLSFTPERNRVVINACFWRIAAKTIDGTFPEWRRVLPKAEVLRSPLVVRRPEFLAAMLGALTAGRPHSQPAWFRPSGGVLHIDLKDDREPGRTVLVKVPGDAAEWQAPEGAAGFCAQLRYVADICQAMPGGLEMRPNVDPDGPVEIRGQRNLGALMPMKGR